MSRAPGGGGIFTVKIPTFSGKTAENVMGVYGIDCPAIFWDRECTTFWGGGRGCAGALTRPSTRHLPLKNFEKTALRKRGGIFTVQMRGGHNYGNDCILNWRFYHKKGGLRLIGCLLALDKR